MMLNVILVAVDFQCLEFDHHSKIMTLFPSMAGSENIYEFDVLFGGLKIKKMDFTVAFPQSGSSSTVFRAN